MSVALHPNNNCSSSASRTTTTQPVVDAKKTPSCISIKLDPVSKKTFDSVLESICKNPSHPNSYMNLLRILTYLEDVKELSAFTHFIHGYRRGCHSLLYWIIGWGKSSSTTEKLLDKLLSIPLDYEARKDAYQACIKREKQHEFQRVRLARGPDESETVKAAWYAKVKGLPLDNVLSMTPEKPWSQFDENESAVVIKKLVRFDVQWVLPQFEQRVKHMLPGSVLGTEFISQRGIWELRLLPAEHPGEYSLSINPSAEYSSTPITTFNIEIFLSPNFEAGVKSSCEAPGIFARLLRRDTTANLTKLTLTNACSAKRIPNFQELLNSKGDLVLRIRRTC